MDIKFFARKSVVYISAIVAASLIFLALATTTRVLSGHSTTHIPLTAAVAIAVMVSILFQPLKTWIQASLNRYLYRESYDYQRTIRDASRDLITILDPHLLVTFLADVIDRTLRCETVAMYLPDPTERTFVLTAATNRTTQHSIQSALAVSSWLVGFLKRERCPFIREETPRDSDHDFLTRPANELRHLGGEIAFPMLEGDTLSGVLVVGPKLSGDPYLSDDVDLIYTLVGQAALAMKNAHLYREIVLANERIENILETMDNAVVAVNADGTVILFNSAAERITRLDASVVKGKPIHNLPTAFLEPIASTLRDGQRRLQFETVLRNSGKRPTPLIYSTSTLKDRSGSILGVAAVFSDVTKLNDLEAEKRRTERLASIGALASGIAHEIKNPLVAIKTFAELLPERFSEEDFRNEFAGVVIREIERIDGLIARLRGLAAPPARLLSAIDIRVPIAETLALLRGQFEQSQVTVRTAYESDSTIIAGDAAQLKQLFINLFVNAVEAMGPGGTLTIRVSPHDVQGSASLIVEVIDNGMGIPDNLLGKIFEPFVTTKQRGSGLGLSICRGIADSHSATIRARNNTTGEGATITVEFPITSEIPAAFGAARDSR